MLKTLPDASVRRNQKREAEGIPHPMTRSGVCSVSLSWCQKDGHIPGGPLWMVQWLPHGYAPTKDDVLICTFFDSGGKWNHYGLAREKLPPLLRTICEATEAHLREHPEDLADHFIMRETRSARDAFVRATSDAMDPEFTDEDRAEALQHADEALSRLAEEGWHLCHAEGKLTDPIAVHINMLRGTIAKPSVKNIIHLYGREALLKELCEEGFVVVPREPTKDMLERATTAFIKSKFARDNTAFGREHAVRYDDMLAAMLAAIDGKEKG